jgi:hypothetical protein
MSVGRYDIYCDIMLTLYHDDNVELRLTVNTQKCNSLLLSSAPRKTSPLTFSKSIVPSITVGI